MSKKKIVLLTGSELRHDFFRKFISDDPEIDVLVTFCESQKGNLKDKVAHENVSNSLRLKHLEARRITEEDFFGLFCSTVEDNSNPIYIERGQINDPEIVEKIIKNNPDLIISFGCSIIKSKLLDVFHKKFINIHLGLSPYYRGAGTNFWPIINRELQCIGTTFMHIDAGIDTGEIIHQIRASIYYNDNIHQIGNRLILNSFITCKTIIKSFETLKTLKPIEFDISEGHYYRNKDFTEDSLEIAYKNMSKKLVEKYLENKTMFDNNYPILKNRLQIV